ncbi:polymerase [Ralstonia pickettii]|uniref:Polymerase n=1 Tax=Ralstonia pickettii TaxID=329 RepID=A0A2N4TWH5_RALPI|nr:O-antigen ligase family protein [Ralstonia pickettii]PLC44062.1 polymerase [Ralstonia pickettii]
MRRLPVLLCLIWLALGACWAIPFLVAPHTYPIPTFYAETAAAACWIVLAVLVLLVTWKQPSGLPSIALAPLALIVVLILQLAIAAPLNPFFSFGAIVALLASIVICVLGVHCRGMPGILEAVAVAVIVGGLLTVAIELLQLFRVPNLPSAFFSMLPSGAGRRMWGNLNQPNQVATYLAFGLAACLFLAHRYPQWRALQVGVMLLLLLGMALTFSRMAWLHVVVVGLLAGVSLGAESRARTCPARLLVLVAPMLALVLVFQGWNWLIAVANSIWTFDLPNSMGERLEAGVGLRSLLWKHAWHIFLAHPWLGGGWGDYAWNQFVQTETVGHVEMSMNAHDIALDLLAKAGLAGLLAVFVPLAFWALGLRKRLCNPDAAFFFTLVAVMLVHSLLEYPLHYVFFLFPFAFVLGYLDGKVLRFPSSGMTWVLSVAIVVCGMALVLRLWPDYKGVERLYFTQDGVPKELARYQSSGQALLVPYATLVIAMNASVNPEMAPVMATLERQAAQFYPGPAPVQRWAIALAFQGKTDEAITQVRRLHNQYWTDYANESKLLTVVCTEKMEGLETFCARLKAEHLLAGAD